MIIVMLLVMKYESNTIRNDNNPRNNRFSTNKNDNNNKKHDKSVTVQFAKVGTRQSEFTLRTGKTALIRLPKFIPTN